MPTRLHDGAFYPKDPLTAAEALALLDRDFAATDDPRAYVGFALEELRCRGCVDATVAARVRADLEALCDTFPPSHKVYGPQLASAVHRTGE